MVFVLLTAGIDLSVGSIMFLGPAGRGAPHARRRRRRGGVALAGLLARGRLLGGINAVFIVGLRVIPFIVTLSTLFLFRGFGTWLTESRQIDFPDSIRAFGLAAPSESRCPILPSRSWRSWPTSRCATPPSGATSTPSATTPLAARKAGLPVRRIEAAVYVISGTLASLAGFILIAQIGRLDTGFGEGREFDVIAAAVLGGASLFGGVGGAGARSWARSPFRRSRRASSSPASTCTSSRSSKAR
jgi:ribose/xylose/arabinose/galactoside ABC-type transport system permease subunit